MAQSAGKVSPGNNGQTDVGRGMKATLPLPSAPRGREQSVVGKLGKAPNSNAPGDLVRRVPNKGAQTNNLG